MANTTSQIRIIFDGTAKGVVAAAAAARSAISGLNDENDRLAKFTDRAGSGLLAVTKGIAALGAAGSAVQVIGGVAGALVQLAPAALLLPGALLGGAAAMGTLKLATAGMGDALKAGLSGDMAKFAEATKGMAPAMQQAAKAVVAFKPQIDDLKKTVQGNFWAGFSGEIQKLGIAYLPVLKTGLGGIGTALGNMAKSFTGTLRQASAIRDVNDILKATEAFLNNAQFAAAHLAAGFLKLGGAGAQYLSGFGTGLGIVTAKFRAWADEAVGSGRIFTWIDGAIQGFKELAAIVGNIGSILGSVFTGLGGQISSPLSALRDLTGQLAAFLKTAEAQDALRSLGEVLSTAASVMRDVMAAALREIAPLMVALGPAAKAVAQGVGDFLVGAIKTVGPLLQGLARFLSDNADSIRAAIPLVLTVAAGIKGLLIAKTVVAGVRLLGTAIAFLGTKAGLWAAAIVAATDVAIGAIKGYSKAQEEAFAKGGFGDDINTFVQDFKVEPLQAIGKEIRASLTPPAETQGLWKTISDSFKTDFVDVMVAAPARIKSSFQTDFLGVFAALPGQIGGLLSGLGTTISTAASSAWNFLVTTAQTAITAAVTFVTGLPGQIGSALSTLGSSIAAAATGAWDSLVAATQTAVAATVAFVTDLPFKVGFALGSLAGIIASAAVAAWNFLVTAATTAVNATVAFVTSLPGKVGAALSALGSTIVSVATSAWASFTSAVTAGANATVNFVRSVPGLVAGALSALGSSIVSVATSAWNAFRNAVVAGVNAVVAFVRGVPGMIVSALSALAGLLTSSATSAANGFRNGLTSGFNAAVAFVRGIPGAIAGALGNLGGLLVGAGRAIMDGFLSGLRSAAAAVTNFVSGFVAGIRAYFPFSPAEKGAFSGSGWVLYSGHALMEGFAQGIQQKTGLITSAVDAAMQAAQGRLSSELSATVSPSVQMASSGLSLSAPDTTAATLRQLLTLQAQQAPIEVTVLLDGQPVHDIARTEIATSSRLTRRTVGMGAGSTF